MYADYGDRVHFYVVYIQEAHPTDGWQLPINEQEEVLFAQPKTDGDREHVAHACSLGLDISIPMLIDRITNEVERAYAALPDRLYLVDAGGKIAYRSEPGPWGFKPDELEAAITTVFEERSDAVDMAE